MTRDLSEALREAERRYRTLFEQAPLGVFLYDRALRIFDCNARFVEILRSSRERLVGLDMHVLRDKRVLPAIESALAGDPSHYEGPYDATTGDAKLCVSMRCAPLRDAGGAVVGGMGVVEDVTERMRAESALRTSEQRLALHVRRSPLGVVAFDVEGRVLEWNASATRIFGWREDEAIGKSAIDLLVPERSREAIRDVFRALVARSGGERSINENVTKDGRVILCDWYNTPLVDDAGHTIGVASMVDDITEQRQAHRALERSEARFRALIENAPDAVAVYPPDDRHIVYANSALAQMLGYDTPADLIGTRIDALIHPDDHAMLDRRIAMIASARGVLPPREYRVVRKDGSVMHAELVSLLLEYDGKPHVIAFGRDLTERKDLQARLLLADRMVSVGTLAAGVAHEINNPLAYLMTNLDMASSRRLPAVAERLRAMGAEPAEIGDEIARAIAMIEVAREGAERVRDIVRDLRTFTRADEEKHTAVDVRRVLDASINLAWNEIRHRARLVKEYGEVPPISANEAKLGQVFLNLLLNAAQALQVGGAADHVIRVRASTDARANVVVEVSDTGQGIAPEILRRVFDPFFTTKPVGLGTGLGLWICQGIVSSLGGQIAAESTPGKGATFRVVLPSATTAAKAGSAPSLPQQTSAPAAVKPKLLVVDDEIAIGRTLAIALGDDFDVATASSGREALERMESGARYDVVLCDLMMPDVSGMDVYERIAQMLPATAARFVFVTGGAFTERARQFVDRVGAPVVEKPFDLGRVAAVLRERAR